MPDASWDKAKALFIRLRELSPQDRRSVLDDECADAPSLRQDVESLLAHHDGADAFLEASAFEHIGLPTAAHLAEADRPDPHVGMQVGPYRVIRRIAFGGMGTVYEAEQLNPRRRVALKLLRREFMTGGNARRFAYESQILAHLRHEGIATVFDAGACDDNGFRVPYFAMELLEDAKSITRYAENNRLTLQQRLRLFVRVCDAVHFGHQHGIIHRDLKPANILVDAAGRAKVIDFGVARTLNADIAAVTLATESGHILGTPQYMSPEQFDGNPHVIDTRSDVYSLGVVLYELISSRLPYLVDDAPIVTIAKVVKEQAPKRLTSIDRKLGGDLETIILTAMAKEPDRRYPSAAEFARDIERYLDDAPILARPASPAYHFAKFAKRHPAIVTSIAVAVAALVTASIVSSHYAFRASEAGRREAVRAQEALEARDAEAEARSLADQRRVEAEFQAYVANIAAAAIELRAGGVAEARMRLDRTPPGLRHWEYGYLVGQLDDSERSIQNLEGPAYHVEFRPDGRQFATSIADASGDTGSQRVWDFATCREISQRHRPRFNSGDVAYDRTGARLAVCSDGCVEVFSANDLQEPTHRFELPDVYVTGVQMMPDGTAVLASTMDGALCKWRLDTNERVAQVEDFGQGITGFDVSSDGSMIAVAARDRRIRVFDSTLTKTRLISDELPTSLAGVRFSNDGTLLAVCVANAGQVVIWNTEDWTITRTIQAPTGQVAQVRFSPDGSLLAAVGSFKDLLIWQVATGDVAAAGRGHAQHVNDVAFHPSGKWIATTSHDRSIRIWNVAALMRNKLLHGHQRLIRAVRFSPDGSLLATCAFDGTARLWRVADRSLVRTIRGTTERLQDVAFSVDGKTLMLAERDGILSYWNVETGNALRQVTGHAYAIHAIAVDPLGRWIATAGIDGRIVIRDAATADERCAFQAHDTRINGLDASPDGRFVVSGSHDGTARIWDVDAMLEGGVGRTAVAPAAVRVLNGHARPLEAVRFSPDGLTLATGSEDHAIRIWDASTGNTIRTLEGHIGGILELDYSPDGKRLVSSAYDTNVILWDVDRGEAVMSLRGHDAWVWGVAFSPDGRCIASAEGPYGQRDCVARIWDSVPWN